MDKRQKIERWGIKKEGQMHRAVRSPTFLSVDEDLWEWELFPATGWDGEMAQPYAEQSDSIHWS